MTASLRFHDGESRFSLRPCDRVPVTTAIFEVRRAVRDALAALPEAARRAPLVVGCSGGADSLALTLAAAAVRGPDDVRAVVVDHRLQEGSAERAAATVALLAERGIAARVHAVDVTGPGGIEAAARRARQAALCAARPHPDSPILLGHTLDDQAETVLLGLGRGSGARSLAGMRRWDPPWLRPLLTVRRTTTRAACAGLDGVGRPAQRRPPLHPRPAAPRGPAAAGGRAVGRRGRGARPHRRAAPGRRRRPRRRRRPAPRRRALPPTPPRGSAHQPAARAGPPVPPPTRGPAAPSADAPGPPAPELDLAVLADVPPALRRRVLRAWLTAAGVTGLTATHLHAADALAAHGPDRAGVAVPGGLELYRAHGRLGIRPVRWPSAR